MWDHYLTSPSSLVPQVQRGASAAAQQTPPQQIPCPVGLWEGWTLRTRAVLSPLAEKWNSEMSREARELHASNHRNPRVRLAHERLSCTAQVAGGWRLVGTGKQGWVGRGQAGGRAYGGLAGLGQAPFRPEQWERERKLEVFKG